MNLDSLTPKQLARYNDSLEVLRLMREGASFYKATNMVGVNPQTAKKILAKTLLKKKNRLVARKSDSLVRQVRLYENGKQVFIQVKGKSNSRKIAQYHSAVGQRFDKNNPVPLEAFNGMVVKDVFGKYHSFETDVSKIKELLLSQETPEFRTIYKV